MNKTTLFNTVVLASLAVLWGGCSLLMVKQAPIVERIDGRTFPSIFQAWNPIDMNDVPLETNGDRLQAAARHDLLWEEPVSQLGYGVDLVLGAVWDHEHGGLAAGFTNASLKRARANRRAMLKINPNMVFLMEIRWKDAPGSYLPADSEWWLRSCDGEREAGWNGGPEPYYYLNYQNPEFRARVVEQSRLAVESGVYDGIMLDWWGSHGENEPNAIDMLSKIRETIGPDSLIVVNSDRLAPLHHSAPYINGAFLEMVEEWHSGPPQWQEIREQLKWFEANLRSPVINCLEIQAGSPSDMRAGLALALIYTDGYYLFSKYDNRDPSPDHLHEWFDIYDVDLGVPTGPPVSPSKDRPEGAAFREFEKGTVVYNPLVNLEITIEFEEEHTRASTGEVGTSFALPKGDGDFFIINTP